MTNERDSSNCTFVSGRAATPFDFASSAVASIWRRSLANALRSSGFAASRATASGGKPKPSTTSAMSAAVRLTPPAGNGDDAPRGGARFAARALKW